MKLLRRARLIRFLQNAFLVIASILIAVVVIELGVRLFFPEHIETASNRSFWQHDPLLGWKYRPGETGTMFFPQRMEHNPLVRIEMNSAGFRDRERSFSPPAGRRRVACIGDSYVFGYGVEFDYVLTTLIERWEPRLEVLNFGVSAYSTDQELLLLENTVLDYRPEVVMLFVTRNDFKGNTSTVMYSYPKPRYILDNGGLKLANVPVPKHKGAFVFAIDRFLLRHSAAYSLAKFRAGRGSAVRHWVRDTLAPAETDRPPDIDQDADNRGKDRGDEARITVALIETFARLCKSAGAVPVLVLCPDEFPPPPAVRGRKARLGDYCEQKGVCEVLDLHPAFGGFDGDRSSLFLSGDFHWSVRGHQVAAERLTGELRSLLDLE